MEDMEDTLETSALLPFLSSSQFQLPFTFISSSTPAIHSPSLPPAGSPQATPCRPSRPRAPRCGLVPAGFPIHNQPLGSCPNILAMDQHYKNHGLMD